MRTHITIVLATILLTFFSVSPRSHYATVHNRFLSLTRNISEQLPHDAKHFIQDDKLIIDNSSSVMTTITDTTLLGNEYTYAVRASQMNKRNAWGVIFNYADTNNYHYAIVDTENKALFDDINDKLVMRISTYQCVNGEHQLVAEKLLEKGVDFGGLNTLSVTVNGQEANIYFGKKKLQPACRIALDRSLKRPVKAGVCLSPNSKIAIERTVMTTNDNPVTRHETDWTIQSLSQYFMASSDPMEGFWQYLDRDIDDNVLRVGGRYTIAIVSAESGYDLIYIEGAQVNASHWKVGMLKGHINKTIFDGHYDLKWFDAMFAPIEQDAYATFDNGVLITLNFPVYRSQIRLSKKLNP